jgi:hypothetical protein
VSARVLALANAGRPDCKRAKVVDSEILEVHGDGKPAAERWVVDRCDERVGYRVSFPATGSRAPIQVRPD